MKLLIDIGNTRLKWAFVADDVLLEPGVGMHGGQPAEAVRALPARTIDAVWLAHVAGRDQETTIIEAVRERYGLDPQLARSAPSWKGLRNAYREPLRLGIDRWLAMIAAWQQCGGEAPLCVVDAGTALTVDVIAQDGEHLGGIIAGGLQTQTRALLGATRFSTRDVADTDTGPLGNDTESCVRQGAVLACLGAIDRARAVAGASAHCIVTGGDAPALLAHLGQPWQHDPHLVLRGLQALSEAP